MKIRKIVLGPYCYNWTIWFAWYPVKTVSKKWVWLRYIFKRKVRVICQLGGIYEDRIQYGTVFDLVQNNYSSFEDFN